MLKTNVRINGKVLFDTKQIREAKAKELATALSAATPVDTGEASRGWHVVNDGKHSFVQNKVDHIVQLNEGHSKQAGAHFIEQTVLSISGVIPNGIIVQTDPP
jgi:hypothetical protein